MKALWQRTTKSGREVLASFLKNGGRLVRQRWKLGLVLLLVVAGSGWWYYRRTQAAKPQLVFEKPQQGNLTKTLQVSGIVEADKKALLRFVAGGKIVYLGAQAGDYVKKGQTIATIDRRDLEKRLAQDLNAYLKERWDWDQTLDNTKDRALPKSESRAKDKSQWDLTDTVLDVEIRDIAISNTVLSAPFAGILTKSPTPVAGVTVTAAEGFELVDPSSLIFKAGVDESDIGLVKLGQKASITLDAYPDQPIATYVSDIAVQSSESTSGTVFVVSFTIPSQSDLQLYRLGMNGDVTIEVDERKNVLHIPLDATRQRGDTTYVDVRTGQNTASERAIKVDLETDDRVEVIKGLGRDDEVVIPK